MSPFEKLVLRGMWIILKHVMLNGKWNTGTDEVMWCQDVAKATGDDELTASEFDKAIRHR